MLDAVGLIHMNGRIYDPLLGRFMSADPTLQYPSDMQNYNRYSYVHNNPLSLTDPSGFGFLKKVKKAFKSIGKAIKSALKTIAQNELLSAIVTIGVGFGAFTLASRFIASKIIAGAIGGFAGGFIGSGGDIKAGVVGGLSGAAFGAIGAKFGKPELFSAKHFIKIGLHGLVGGAASAAQGGKFGRGFLSAGVTQAFAPGIDGFDGSNEGISLSRTIAAAVVGGTTSEITGGKFANGAVTGAFSRLFNDELDRRETEKTNPVTLLLGTGGSAVILKGYEASFGGLLTIGNLSDFDIGLFYSSGDAYGLNVSLDVFAGALPGSVWELRGESINANIVVYDVSVTTATTITYENNTVRINDVGNTVGLGPAIPIPIQGSISFPTTRAYSYRTLIRSTTDFLCSASGNC